MLLPLLFLWTSCGQSFHYRKSLIFKYKFSCGQKIASCGQLVELRKICGLGILYVFTASLSINKDSLFHLGYQEANLPI